MLLATSVLAGCVGYGQTDTEDANFSDIAECNPDSNHFLQILEEHDSTRITSTTELELGEDSLFDVFIQDDRVEYGKELFSLNLSWAIEKFYTHYGVYDDMRNGLVSGESDDRIKYKIFIQDNLVSGNIQDIENRVLRPGNFMTGNPDCVVKGKGDDLIEMPTVVLSASTVNDLRLRSRVEVGEASELEISTYLSAITAVWEEIHHAHQRLDGMNFDGKYGSWAREFGAQVANQAAVMKYAEEIGQPVFRDIVYSSNVNTMFTRSRSDLAQYEGIGDGVSEFSTTDSQPYSAGQIAALAMFDSRYGFVSDRALSLEDWLDFEEYVAGSSVVVNDDEYSQYYWSMLVKYLNNKGIDTFPSTQGEFAMQMFLKMLVIESDNDNFTWDVTAKDLYHMVPFGINYPDNFTIGVTNVVEEWSIDWSPIVEDVEGRVYLSDPMFVGTIDGSYGFFEKGEHYLGEGRKIFFPAETVNQYSIEIFFDSGI